MPIDEIKAVLGIELLDSSKDVLLNVYVKEGTVLIKNYLKVASTMDVQTLYPEAVSKYVVTAMAKRGNEGLKSFAQGSRSGTYADDLPEAVKALLPSPYIRMR